MTPSCTRFCRSFGGTPSTALACLSLSVRLCIWLNHLKFRWLSDGNQGVLNNRIGFRRVFFISTADRRLYLGFPIPCRRFEEEIHSPSVTSNLAPNFISLHHCHSTGSIATPHSAGTSGKEAEHITPV